MRFNETPVDAVSLMKAIGESIRAVGTGKDIIKPHGSTGRLA
jgi:hypothetical protein